MKKVISAVIAIVMAVTVAVLCMPVSLAATVVDSGSMEDFQWCLYDDGNLLVEGSGSMDTLDNYNVLWEKYSGQVSSVTISDGIIELHPAFFDRLYNVEEIQIPAEGFVCDGETFAGCDSLKRISISGESSEYLVSDCALYNKNKTKLIRYPAGKENEEFNVPDTVKIIGNSAFDGSENLKKVVLSSGLTKIEEYAFVGCDSLTNIEIPQSVTSIEYYAFGGCDSLSSIEIPEGVTAIGESLFESCPALKKVVIPKSVVEIDRSCVTYCDSFEGFAYCGSAEDWKSISFVGDFNNSGMIGYESKYDSFDDIAVIYNYKSASADTNDKTEVNKTEKDTNTAEKMTEKTKDKLKNDTDDSNNTVVILVIAIAAAAVLIVAIIAILIIKKKG